MSENFCDVVCILGLAGIGVGLYASWRAEKACRTINRSVDEAAKGIDVNVREDLVRAAIDRAVERESERAVREASKKAISRIEEQIHAEVAKSVRDAYQDTKKSVASELRRQAANVDIRELKDEVVEEAKEAISEKFDSKLDDILEDFNDRLGNVGKIYQSIADAMSGTKTVQFKM